MATYRNSTSYRNGFAYRRGFRPSAAYRNGLPYRNGGTYRAEETSVDVNHPGNFGTYAACWTRPTAGSHVHSAPFGAAQQFGELCSVEWRAGQAQFSSANLPLHQMLARGHGANLPWSETSERAERAAAWPYVQPSPWGEAPSLPWGDIEGRRCAAIHAPWSRMTPRDVTNAARWDTLAVHGLAQSLLWRRLVERGAYVALPWSPIAARSSSTVIVWPPTPPTDDDTIIVPDLPVYVMLPTMTAVRLPDRTPIPLLSISLQEEAGGFAWSFSAPMARAGLALVNPDTGDAPQIEVTINGYVWTFIVDAYDDNRRFASNTLTLRGRSLAAGLAAPHATTRTFTQAADRNASQLADEELPVGWTLVWDAVDWLVPGGTFSYQDLAPIEAIAQVASAIGAAVRSHPSEPTLEVVPTYPVSPWAWDEAAPYAVLPAGVLGDGSSSWQGGVNPNGIFVYAQNAPTGARVVLAGTDGAIQLPMVVDPLLVHADAQRERGRHELASAGKARTVQRTVPLFPSPVPEGMPELGVVRPGVLLELQDPDETWLGMVTAVRIDAQRSGRALSVRQHLTIERQYR